MDILNQKEIAQLITLVGAKITYYIALAVVSFIIGITIKNIGTLIFTWISISFSREQGTRQHDLVERSGQIYEIINIGFSRITMQNIDNADDQRHLPITKFWQSEIHSVECKQAYKHLLSNKEDTGTKKK